jgi:hypothetical protein
MSNEVDINVGIDANDEGAHIEMEVGNNASAAMTAANEMMSRNVKPQTIKKYKQMIVQMEDWMRNNNPEALDNNNKLRCPLDDDMVMSFFGHLGSITTDAGVIKATSTVSAYRSALLWHYKNHRKKLSDSIQSQLAQYLAGYKRTVSSLKLQGVMSVFEGKQPLPFEGIRYNLS